jgi:hypothetical protein
MYKPIRFVVLVTGFVFAMQKQLAAQEPVNKKDTFFLAKKTGLLGRLGKSIATSGVDEVPQKIENQFLQYKGKIIRSIQLQSLGFERNIYDTNLVK